MSDDESPISTPARCHQKKHVASASIIQEGIHAHFQLFHYFCISSFSFLPFFVDQPSGSIGSNPVDVNALPESPEP